MIETERKREEGDHENILLQSDEKKLFCLFKV